MAIAHVREATGAEYVSLLGGGFVGGICAYYAAEGSGEITRLVLLNYKTRTIDSRLDWETDYLSDEAARQITEQDYFQFTPALRHGPAILE